MKRILIVLLTLITICGCTNTKEVSEPKNLSIVTPLGAPVLAFYDQIENENYLRVQANAISALWSADEKYDVIVCDVTSGIQAINNGANYKLSAVITFGNLYLCSTGNDVDNTMSKDDKIVLFGSENMFPNKVWHYLFGDEFDDCLYFENSATEAARALTSGVNSENEPVDYVFLAQPAMFAALKNNEKASLYLDIQKEYFDKTGSNYVQAAVFTKADLDKKDVDTFLNNLSESINNAIEDPSLAEKGLSVYTGDEATAQYGFNPNVVLNVFKQKNALGINAMGLGYKKAIDIKEDIDLMMSIFGLSETNEEIYFK